ncbi:Metal-dependent hydrolase, endonuclease/exonuclease/phosphatase family [Paracoccus aminovorans]|uniref:Metal-dependent hydrolase, endonuclease/exonuclease/phosphatase family n=1 Tax=Paracoccus aminovorans TaxID=34004 RepID=A0A1I3C3I7_9RHOB|nr:endonuclease/exonuclease/phosphatase family protein [Paracoccus aminovorans]CQR86420.1 metal-dependent hydrolase [Paracoccus aminovorans]SFH68896.1 Metal-dependent hydrolase, endonuclease/exonuclease/phosphatase family [Paracoccus aminovorans]
MQNSPDPLRLASYNLHKCRGMTGPHAPERNLAVIAELGADVVALQEVDFRFGARPEALPRALIEKTTGMVPAPFLGTGENSLGWHGQTILLRPELRDKAQIRRLPLPGIEPRGALVLRLPGLTVVALHLGLIRSSRRAQLSRIIAQARRIGHDRLVLTGDFNEWHDSRGLEALEPLRVIAPGPSWPAPFPRLRYDRFALSRSIDVLDCGVLDSEMARQASDHLPVWADLAVDAQEEVPRGYQPARITSRIPDGGDPAGKE